MSIIPEPYYYQGIDKEWTRQSRVDYYWPSFAHLGEQEIDKSELSNDIRALRPMPFFGTPSI
jgi:hypothetical protein